jgi:hypothetical protein
MSMVRMPSKRKSIARALFLMVGIAGGVASAASAQNAPPPQPQRPAAQDAQPDRRTYRLQIVVAHYDGDRRVSSVPNTIVGSMGTTVTVSSGLQVPVVNSAAGTGVSNFTFKQIGFNATVVVRPLEDGRFSLSQFTVEESSVLPDKAAGASPVSVNGVPVFSDYIVTTALNMSDGETIQLATAASPLTGQVTKIDVTLNVLKPPAPSSGRE